MISTTKETWNDIVAPIFSIMCCFGCLSFSIGVITMVFDYNTTHPAYLLLVVGIILILIPYIISYIWKEKIKPLEEIDNNYFTLN